MRRTLKYLLLLVIGVLALAMSGLGFLAGTEAGSRWLIREASFYLPGELQIGATHGRLISGLVLSDVDYRLDESELRMARLELRWRAAALLRGTLHIQQLRAQTVQYREPQAAPGAAPFAPPERISLPFAVVLDKASVSGLQVTLGDEQSVVDEITLSARAGPLRGLEVKQLEVRLPDSGAQLSGTAVLRRPYAFKCKIRWHAQLPDQVAANGQARLKGDLNQLRIDHTLSQPFRLTTLGTVRLGGDTPEYQLSGHWQNLHWPLAGAAEYTSAQGDYRFAGTLEAYRLSLNGPLEGPDIPATEVRAAGHGDLQRINIESLDVTGLGGSARATGTLAWAPGFDLALTINAADIDPGQHWPQWPGRLDLATKLQVATQDDSTVVAFRELDLQGTLHGRPVAAQGELTLRDGVPATTGLAVSSGDNTISLTGALDARSGLRYQLTARELPALLAGLTGRAEASGILKGPPERLAGSLELTANKLAYRGKSLATLNLSAQFDTARPAAAEARLRADSIDLGTERIDTLTLESHGWLDKQQARLQLSSPRASATLEIGGGYSDGVWNGRLETATIDSRELGDWQLRAPLALRIGAAEVSPFRGCWESGQREVCVQGKRGADEAQLALTARSAEGHLQADANIGRLRTNRPTLTGQLSLVIPDIAFIDALLPRVTVAGGALTAEARLGGYLDAPEINGTAVLDKGLVKIPELGLELNAIALRAQGDGTRVALNGTAHSGKGEVRLDGRLLLAPRQAWPFDLTLKGERFAIARLPDIDILANPDLRVDGSLQRVDVGGSVLIPHARIELAKLPPDVVKVSSDQVIVGPAASAQQAPSATVPVSLDLVVTLGDDVHFDGLGLSTNLAGSLNVRSLKGGTLIGNGVLELVNGRFDGYGPKLAIEQGRLLFAGPLENPALDVRATRTAGDVVAGIQLSGTVESPQTSLFSDPAMSDAETMSYLVTGRPLSAASSGSDSQALTAAAASLGANSPVAKEISDKLGIGVGVQSGATDADTSLVVSKQVSPRLQVDYLYGMFTESTAIQFVYELTRHFSLAGQSGTAQSIDLRFSIHRP